MNAAPEWHDNSAQQIDESLSSLMQEAGVTGMAFGVVIGDELVFASGYGLRELGKQGPINERSVFHWASVSKPFVATAIMQLVESDQLSLEDRLGVLLPYFLMADDRFHDITVRQLLTHTSGMPDVEDYQWENPQFDDEALKRWAQEQAAATLLFAPGTNREYSNLGFELLGLIVQEVSGVSFERYMQENIFQPLAMNDSSFIASEINPALRTTGHVGEPIRTVANAYPYNRRHAPSSTLNTNIVDMARFAAAMLNEGALGDSRIIAANTLATMWSPAWTSTDDPHRQASLGWNVSRFGGVLKIISHGGHDDGFRSFLAIAPQERVSVFVVSNDDNAPVGPFALAALAVLYPELAAAAENED